MNTQAYKPGVASGNFCRATWRSAGERENAQAGGMNKTVSHEFALGQAAPQSIPLSVADPLKEAKELLTQALIHSQHAEDCRAQAFVDRNHHLPANHPGWKAQPVCTCWVGRLAAWLNNNSEI
jgi:hypothetical protein